MDGNGAMEVTNSEGTAKMQAGGSVPSDWPKDAPIYAGATVTYSAAVSPTSGKPGNALLLTSNDSVTKVSDFYKKELAAKGWTITAAMQSGEAMIIGATKDSRTLGISIAGAEEGQTAITIGIESSK
jgi:hypothetical protein